MSQSMTHRVSTLTSRAQYDTYDFSSHIEAAAEYAGWRDEVSHLPATLVAENKMEHTVHAALWELRDGRWCLLEQVVYSQRKPRARSRLTPRETETLWLLAAGNSSKSIARLMGISDRTVNTHRLSIARKYTCKGLPSMVSLAVRLGLGPGTPSPTQDLPTPAGEPALSDDRVPE